MKLTNFLISSSALASATLFMCASASASILGLTSFDLLDPEPDLPARAQNSRAAWDDYNLTLSHSVQGTLQLRWQAQAGMSQYKVAYQLASGEWVETHVQSNILDLSTLVEQPTSFKVVGCLTATQCDDYGNELSAQVSDVGANALFIYLPQYVPADEGFRISWSAVTEAQQYQLQRADFGGQYHTVSTVHHQPEFPDFHYDEQALAAGQYCYRVNVVLANEVTSQSLPVCTQVAMREMATPSGFLAESTEPGVYNLNWQPVERAHYYQLERETLTLETVRVEQSTEGVEPSLVLASPMMRAAMPSAIPLTMSAMASSSRSARVLTLPAASPVLEQQKFTKTWQSIESRKVTHKTQVHTLGTFELGGAQNYRLSACDRNNTCSKPHPMSYQVPISNAVNAKATGAKAGKSTTDQNAVSLTWDPVPDADMYTVKMRRKGAQWESYFTGITETQFSEKIRLAGEYHFEIQACIKEGYCGEVVPVGNTVTFTLNSPNNAMTPEYILVPNKVNAGEPFDVKWRAPRQQGFVEFELQGELSSTLKRDKTDNFGYDAQSGFYYDTRPALPHGREYCYKVRAWYEGQVGSYTGTECTVVGTKVFDAVRFMNANLVSAQTVSISWEKKSGATNYLLEFQKKTADGKIEWQPMYLGPESSITQSIDPFHLTQYQRLGHLGYRVSACNAQNVCGDFMRAFLRGLSTSHFGKTASANSKAPACLYVPAQVAAGQSVPITWCDAQADGVVAYDIEGETSSTIFTATAQNAPRNMHTLMETHRTPAAGRSYCYKARARYADGSVSGYTATQCTQVGALAFEPVSYFDAHMSAHNRVSLAWGKVIGAEFYLLEFQTKNSAGMVEWLPIYFGPGQTATQTLDTFHYAQFRQANHLGYRVSACDQAGYCGDHKRDYIQSLSASNFSPVALPINQVPACIYVPSKVVGGKNVPVKWCGAQSQEVAEYQVLGELSNVIYSSRPEMASKDPQGVFELKRTLAHGREYCYKVRTVMHDGSMSDFTPKVCTQVGDINYQAPTSVTLNFVAEGSNQYFVKWPAVVGASKYRLELQTALGQWAPLSCDVTSFTQQGKPYYGCTILLGEGDKVPELGWSVLRISACNANGGGCGNYIRVPVMQAPILSGSRTLTWTSPVDTHYFILERAQCSSSCSATTSLDWQHVTQTTESQYKQPTTDKGKYLYRVKGCNTVQCSPWSNTVEASSKKQVIFIHTDLLGSPVAESTLN
ncbi:hypothetical protein [Pseudoalteromonas luteoviolacea]|nr:hypothetical protein [Pseudoalteromonas luteoviolacea]